MKRFDCFWVTIVSLVLFLFILPLWVSAADSPWPMFRHDARHTGLGNYETPISPALRWSYICGGDISELCIGLDESIYFGTDIFDSHIYCLKSNGTLNWSYLAGREIVSSPAIGYDGRAYFTSYDQNSYAVSSRGSLLWSYEMGDMHLVSSAAIGSDAVIYLGGGDSFDENIYAFLSSGHLYWSYNPLGWVLSSPAISSDSNTYVGTVNGPLYALDSLGSLKWSYNTNVLNKVT